MISLLLAAALATPPAPHPGKDLVIDRAVEGTVVSVAGDIRVDAPVRGDVVALGGAVMLGPESSVSGDVVALGGTIGGVGSVAGRRVSLGAVRATPALDRAGVGLLLLRLGGWTLLAMLCVLFVRRAVRSSAESLIAAPIRTVLAGVVGMAVWLALAVLGLTIADTPVGVVLVIAGVLVFVGAKVLGLAAVSWLLGDVLATRLPLGLRSEMPRTGIAMLLLAALSVVPLLGSGIWLAANVAGLGAVVALLLGRQPLVLALSRALAR